MASTAPTATASQSIAAALVAARRAARPLPAYPGTLPASLADAYAIQDDALRAMGGDVAGWKVGRIWPPHEQDYGSNRLAGPILARRVFTADSAPAMPVFRGGFGAVEAEFVFRLGHVPLGQQRFTLAEAAATVAAVHVGIEIASSPLAQINDLGPAVTVSDFGNNHGLVIGPAIADWANADIDAWPITLAIDGVTVGSGRSGDFPDGTLGSLRFLLELLVARGIAVPTGTLVSTGAITGVHPIAAGQSASMDFGGRHRIACHITDAVPDIA
ncbi:MAG: 2-keto-4-pentenoate hydratase [Alphaproteobacteria bacterium PA4]|nr:MAG: 2-keto-4-pentenoate hydratase [Alphaproteobacteria bacterium PA4]